MLTLRLFKKLSLLNKGIPKETASYLMSKQEQKYHLSLAGKFYVAAGHKRHE